MYKPTFFLLFRTFQYTCLLLRFLAGKNDCANLENIDLKSHAIRPFLEFIFGDILIGQMTLIFLRNQRGSKNESKEKRMIKGKVK